MARVAKAVGYLPLGLEIAASQLGHLTLPELVKVAERAPHTLKAHYQTVARHESLTELVAASWHQLGQEQKQTLIQLTGCPEPFAQPASASAELSPQTFHTFVRKGFLVRHAHNLYSFPLPFRRFAAEMNRVVLELRDGSRESAA